MNPTWNKKYRNKVKLFRSFGGVGFFRSQHTLTTMLWKLPLHQFLNKYLKISYTVRLCVRKTSFCLLPSTCALLDYSLEHQWQPGTLSIFCNRQYWCLRTMLITSSQSILLNVFFAFHRWWNLISIIYIYIYLKGVNLWICFKNYLI